jgi:hypothetical protein
MNELIKRMLEADSTQRYQDALQEMFREYVSSEFFQSLTSEAKAEMTDRFMFIFSLFGNLMQRPRFSDN